LAVTTYAALRSVRHIPIYVLVAAPLLSAVVQARLQEVVKAGLLDRPLPLTGVKLAVNVMLLAGFLGFAVVRVRYVIDRQPEAEAKEFPTAAVTFLTSSNNEPL
jgi:hypothetical protein